MGIEPTSEGWEKTRAPPPSKTGNDTALAVRCLAGHQPLSNELNRQASYLAEFLFRCCLAITLCAVGQSTRLFGWSVSVGELQKLPPTLFASIWGMNFHYMPELDQAWAYPVAISIIVVSGIVPYLYFKRRGWL